MKKFEIQIFIKIDIKDLEKKKMFNFGFTLKIGQFDFCI